MNKQDRVVVTGAGGFIGGHLVADLRAQGYQKIRAVDIKPLTQWYQRFPEVENIEADLQEYAACERVCQGAREIYNLACNMGGMGFIETHKTECMLSVLVNTHMLMAARKQGVERYLYSSSACVYAADKQTESQLTALKEADAYPAMPEDGYGWEKLFSERLCRHFREDYCLNTRIVRYHNVYGPYGTFAGGREKAPAALCRKIIEAKLSGHHEIEIWGDGEQTRSFTYIDDCLYGTQAVMHSNIIDPINIGSSELVTINQLVDIIETIAGIKLQRHYNLQAPLGVRGRNSDNTFIKQVLGWEPSILLYAGLEKTYRWIYDAMGAAQTTLVG